MITQTEIICWAIRAMDAYIEEWRAKCGGDESIFMNVIAEICEKREALCTLYKIQTGEDYN